MNLATVRRAQATIVGSILENTMLIPCAFSFLVVFILLGILALLIRLLTVFDPAQEARDDAPLVAAIHAAAAIRFPGARVTRIEEIRK